MSRSFGFSLLNSVLFLSINTDLFQQKRVSGVAITRFAGYNHNGINYMEQHLMHEFKDAVLEKVDDDVQEPPMYKVVLFNDDFTTMDFVVIVLMAVFHKSPDEAKNLMLAVHKKGSAVCGVYPFVIAETKVAQVHAMANQYKYPLRCTIEEE